MSSLLVQLVRHARITWDPRNASSLGTNVHQLKQLVDKLSAQDLQLPPGLLNNTTTATTSGVTASSSSPTASSSSISPQSVAASSSPESLTTRRAPPCTFVSLVNEPNVTISVFILNESNSELPLHDHPGMHGLLKAISGQLHVQAYTALDAAGEPTPLPRSSAEGGGAIIVRHEPAVVIDASSPAVLLAPHLSNFHRIRPISGRAAFLDILSPPYQTLIPAWGERQCTYYEPVEAADDVLTLVPTVCPSSFWCNEVTFPWIDRLREDLE